MINEYIAKKYCNEDISLIENYHEALNDKDETWDIHHKLETDLGLSQQELIDTDRYYNVKAKYLIFLTHSEHISLHKRGVSTWIKGKTLSEDYKQKISNGLLHHTVSFETREKIRKKLTGIKRGQYKKHNNDKINALF